MNNTGSQIISSLSKYHLNKSSGLLLKNFTQGCFTTFTENSALQMMKNYKPSLYDIFPFIPSTVISIRQLIINKYPSCRYIRENIILEVYSGSSHFYDQVFIKINNINALTLKTKKPFRQIMKEINISLDSVINRSMFMISDMAIRAKVIKIIDRKHVRLLYETIFGNIILNNVVVPKGIRLKKDDIVITHLGYIAKKINPNNISLTLKNTLEESHKFQMSNKHLRRAIKIIINTQKIIDYSNFCPNNNSGCNLAKIQEKNFHNRNL